MLKVSVCVASYVKGFAWGLSGDNKGMLVIVLQGGYLKRKSIHYNDFVMMMIWCVYNMMGWRTMLLYVLSVKNRGLTWKLMVKALPKRQKCPSLTWLPGPNQKIVIDGFNVCNIPILGLREYLRTTAHANNQKFSRISKLQSQMVSILRLC